MPAIVDGRQRRAGRAASARPRPSPDAARRRASPCPSRCGRARWTPRRCVRDRARDLAFERAAVVHLLEELGGAERGAVEDLEADAARAPACPAPTARAAARRRGRCGTRMPRPPSSSWYGTFIGLQPRDDLPRRFRVHVREEQHVGRRVQPPRRAGDDADDQHEGAGQRDQLRGAERRRQRAKARKQLLRIHVVLGRLQRQRRSTGRWLQPPARSASA